MIMAPRCMCNDEYAYFDVRVGVIIYIYMHMPGIYLHVYIYMYIYILHTYVYVFTYIYTCIRLFVYGYADLCREGREPPEVY